MNFLTTNFLFIKYIYRRKNFASDWINITRFQVTMFIEKAFDTFEHIFIYLCLDKIRTWPTFYHLDRKFINLLTTLCYNGGTTT